MKPVILRNERGLTIKTHEVVYHDRSTIFLESCGTNRCQEISLSADEAAEFVVFLLETEALREHVPYLLSMLLKADDVQELPIGDLDKGISEPVAVEADNEVGESAPVRDMGERMPVVAPLG